MKAILFDCDGVLVDTERDGHRVAFNRAFKHFNINTEWTLQLYGELLEIAGGKERMRHYFDSNFWPEFVGSKNDFIRQLHAAKTELFMEIVNSGELSLRPGVARIVDDAIRANIILAVCSTSSEKAVNLIVERMLSAERKKYFSGIFAGDMVQRKKPDPAVYLLACKELNLDASDCVVIEDSRNGLLAAKAAGMKCLVTISGYTGNEDFSEADSVVSELGESGTDCITLDKLKRL